MIPQKSRSKAVFDWRHWENEHNPNKKIKKNLLKIIIVITMVLQKLLFTVLSFNFYLLL